MKMKWSGVFAAIILTFAWWLVARFLFGVTSLDRLIVWTILGWIFASIVVLAAMRVSNALWIFAGLLVLAALSLPDSMLLEISARLPQPLTDPMTLTYLLTFPVALILGALLLYSAMNLYKEWEMTGSDGCIQPRVTLPSEWMSANRSSTPIERSIRIGNGLCKITDSPRLRRTSGNDLKRKTNESKRHGYPEL